MSSRPTLAAAVPKHKVSSDTSIVPKSAQLSPPLSSVNTSIELVVVVKLASLLSIWSTSRVCCLSPSLVLMVVDVVVVIMVAVAEVVVVTLVLIDAYAVVIVAVLLLVVAKVVVVVRVVAVVLDTVVLEAVVVVATPMQMH